jgi:hypothetical protein
LKERRGANDALGLACSLEQRLPVVELLEGLVDHDVGVIAEAVFLARRWRAATIDRKPIRSNADRRGPTKRRASRIPNTVVTLTRMTARTRLASFPSVGESGNRKLTATNATTSTASKPHQKRWRRSVGTRNQQDMLRITINAAVTPWSLVAV